MCFEFACFSQGYLNINLCYECFRDVKVAWIRRYDRAKPAIYLPWMLWMLVWHSKVGCQNVGWYYIMALVGFLGEFGDTVFKRWLGAFMQACLKQSIANCIWF